MFGKTKAPMPKEMYENSRVLIYFVRLAGCFPFILQTESSRTFLRWSPFLALYGSLLGGMLVFRSHWELFFSYLIPNFFSPTDKVAMFFAHGGWITVYFCGTFVMPWRFAKFLAYIECINEVDAIVGTRYTKSERYKSMVILMIAPIFTLMYCVNNFMYLMSVQLSVLHFFNSTGGFYVLYVLSGTVLYIVRHLFYSVEKRLNALNKILDVKCKGFGHGRDILAEVIKAVEVVPGNLLKFSPKASWENHFGRVELNGSIAHLIKAYLKIMDAVGLLNSLLGETMVVGILTAFVQLVQPLYFTIQHIIDGETAIYNMNGFFVSLFRNLFCALLVIEPVYACILKVKTTEKLVGRLLSRGAKWRNHEEAKTFALCLGLRKIEITGWGLFVIDRLLFTSLIDSSVTFLLLLLQMQQNNRGKSS